MGIYISYGVVRGRMFQLHFQNHKFICVHKQQTNYNKIWRPNSYQKILKNRERTIDELYESTDLRLKYSKNQTVTKVKSSQIIHI